MVFFKWAVHSGLVLRNNAIKLKKKKKTLKKL